MSPVIRILAASALILVSLGSPPAASANEVGCRAARADGDAQACATPAAGAVGRRIALVIGNGRYCVLRLRGTPGNEHRELAGLLRRCPGLDAPRRRANCAQMRAALGRFQQLATNADAALVYYAGHGGRRERISVDECLRAQRRVEGRSRLP